MAATRGETVNRYEITAEFDSLDNCCRIVNTTDDDGMWCLSADVQALTAALTDSHQRNAELAAQVARQAGRIAELEAQLAATLATIEAAAHDGRTYSEGCKP